MFTNEQRLELLEVWEKIRKSATDCLEFHNVLPANITHNGEEVGIKIEFHKVTNKQKANWIPYKEIDNELPDE